MTSRWDALKPDKPSVKNSRRKKSSKATAPASSNRTLQSKPRRTAEEIRRDFTRLQQAYLESRNLESLVDLSNYFETELKNNEFLGPLLADCVARVLLPRFEEIVDILREKKLTNVALQEKSSLQEERSYLHHALRISIGNDVVASALFAPAIQEVADGDELEEPRTNPLGKRLIDCMGYELQTIRHCEILIIDCFADVLDTRSRVEGPKLGSNNKSTLDLDPRVAYRLVEEGFQRQEHTRASAALRLIQILLRYHPDSSSPLLSCILLPNPVSAHAAMKSCQHCATQLPCLSIWLGALHAQNISTSNVFDNLVRCTMRILENAPLSLWLPRNSRNSRPSRTTSWAFRDKIQDGLISLIQICSCRLSQPSCDESDIDLAACILWRIPFQHGDPAMTFPAVQLVEKMIDVWNTRKELFAEKVVDALCSIMGGQTTPQGTLTKMSIPLRMWIESKNGSTFIADILGDEQPSNSSCSRTFLSHAVRSVPSICLENTARWEAFAAYIDRGDRGSDGAELLQNLLQGRRDFGHTKLFGVKGECMEIAASWLQIWMSSSEGFEQRLALACYGLLDIQDWAFLISKETLLQHIEQVLLVCENEQISNKIRSDACKNLGYVTTNLVPALHTTPATSSGSDLSQLCERICRAFVTALNSKPEVARMAMFGLGNLAHVLTTITWSRKFLDFDNFGSMAMAVISRLDSDDPKMASNTIRAMSHIVNLASQSYSDEEDAYCRKLMEAALHSFSLRVQQVIALSRGELSTLNWKQRSAVKKLGWGACNALSTIFSNEDGILMLCTCESFEICVENLCQCIMEASNLNDKVVSAAMGALGSLDPDILGRVMEGNHCFIQGLVALVKILLPGEQRKASTETDGTLTLKCLLEVCTITDARDALKCLTTEDIGRLYEWSVQQDLSAEAVGKLALAMQRCDGLDIYWEQRFTSRAQALLQPDDTFDEL